MKKWPKNNAPASFEDLVKPFKQSLRFAYSMRRKNKDKDIPYTGFSNGNLACCPDIVDMFSAENVTYSHEEQGRDVLETIIGAILQVGIEQGRRIAMDSSEWKTLELKAKLADILRAKISS